MKKRTVSLLSYPENPVQINPSDYRRACDGALVKEFDESGTKILRVFRDSTGGPHLVYAMRGESGKVVSEAYDIAPLPDTIPAVVQRVAAHCGVEELVPKVVLP